MFLANTNASLKNLETQEGKLALAVQNQSNDVFPSDSKKNPKDCMVVNLRSGREIESGKEEEKKKTKNVEKEETGKDTKFSSSDLTEETEKEEEQTKQQVEKRGLKKKEETKAYVLLFHSLKGFKKQKWTSSSLDYWMSSRRWRLIFPLLRH